ncbi:MAG: pyrimidine dimer DNA glycosylase/endonuclease V [Pseudomonadota bacterium]
MNIFVTSNIPQEAALHLDDLRLNKMILETAQLLSSAFRHLFSDHSLLYRDTHLNHPCAIWARKNSKNYSWLVEYFDALAEEKYRRDLVMKKPDQVQYHKSWEKLSPLFNSKKTAHKPQSNKLKFFDFNCTEFKDEKDVTVAYKKQLSKKWQNDLRAPKWAGEERR